MERRNGRAGTFRDGRIFGRYRCQRLFERLRRFLFVDGVAVGRLGYPSPGFDVGFRYDGVSARVRLVDDSTHEILSERHLRAFLASVRNRKCRDASFHVLENRSEARLVGSVFRIASVRQDYRHN